MYDQWKAKLASAPLALLPRHGCSGQNSCTEERSGAVQINVVVVNALVV